MIHVTFIHFPHLHDRRQVLTCPRCRQNSLLQGREGGGATARKIIGGCGGGVGWGFALGGSLLSVRFNRRNEPFANLDIWRANWPGFSDARMQGTLVCLDTGRVRNFYQFFETQSISEHARRGMRLFV